VVVIDASADLRRRVTSLLATEPDIDVVLTGVCAAPVKNPPPHQARERRGLAGLPKPPSSRAVLDDGRRLR